MKHACLTVAVALASVLGCGTTGGRVGVGVSGAAAGAVVINQFRLLGCEDGDMPCRDGVRTTGFVLAGVAAAALITAVVFEMTGRPAATAP
jgi:hypothetical protein